MTIKLTDNQINKLLSNLSDQQVIDFLAEDVEKSVDWICQFIHDYVDDEQLQQKIKQSFPPIQMTLFND